MNSRSYFKSCLFVGSHVISSKLRKDFHYDSRRKLCTPLDLNLPVMFPIQQSCLTPHEMHDTFQLYLFCHIFVLDYLTCSCWSLIQNNITAEERVITELHYQVTSWKRGCKQLHMKLSMPSVYPSQ
jgi:hypothetical protein